MRIITSESTYRGMTAIRGMLVELTGRGHSVLLIAMPHPDTGLKYGSPPFMIDDNADMIHLVSGICDIEVLPDYNLGKISSLIADYKADIYITKGDNRMPRDDYICRVIKMSIPSMHIVGLHADAHIYINPGWHSEKFMVAGDYWRSYLCGVGVNYNDITVVGSVKADYVYNNYSRISDDRIIFFDQMIYTRNDRKMIVDQLELISSMMKKPYIIKMHPAWKEYRIPIEDIWSDVSSDMIFEKGNSYELLQYSALSITGNSSTGYESMALGIPTLLLNIAGDQSLYKGCGVDIYDSGQLSCRALDVINGNYDKVGLQCWRDNHYYCDGNSSSRIVDRLEVLYG